MAAGPASGPLNRSDQGSTLDIYLLEVGKSYDYTVPSFPVFSTLLRKMKFTVQDDPKVYDGFIRDCPSLERNYPSLLVVESGCQDSFPVSVEEFSRAVDTEGFVLYDECVFVVWKWKWGENIYDAPDYPFNLSVETDMTTDQGSPLSIPSSESEQESQKVSPTLWCSNVLVQTGTQMHKKFCAWSLKG